MAQYTTLDRVLAKLYRDLGLEDISESDIIEWASEALEAIGVVTLYEEAVAFIEIKNHRATLPKGLHQIIQIARNTQWGKEEKTFCPNDVINEVEGCQECGDSNLHPVILDCKGSPITDVEVAYYRPYFDLQYEYKGWSNSNLRKKYTPVKLSNSSFFSSLVCEEDPELYKSCSDEYTIRDNQIITSFKEGFIALAYYRQKIDPDTGYPMIPDTYSITTALTTYITMKYMGRNYYLGREGYRDKFLKAEQDWQWYCKQAGNEEKMLKGIDEHQKFFEMKTRGIPPVNRYYKFFKK